MNNLIKIEHAGKRVLTTEQLAQVYGCEAKQLLQNFNNNAARFTEGRHYFKLDGDALREFKGSIGSSKLSNNLKFAPNLILWTRRGASRHCKMLGTDQAWEMFDELEETYFNQKELPKLSVNPKYRTRMISTAVRDVEKTKEAIMKMFKVKDGIAYTKAMALIEPAYGIDLAPIKTLVPAATHETGYINPTEIGKRLGGIKPQEVNIMLENMHFQHKEGKDWRLDKAGQDYGEEIPYTRNGHSGYQIRWNANVISALQIGA